MATKKMMLHSPALLHALLEHLTQALTTYVCHQIDSGAQVRSCAPPLPGGRAPGYAGCRAASTICLVLSCFWLCHLTRCLSSGCWPAKPSPLSRA